MTKLNRFRIPSRVIGLISMLVLQAGLAVPAFAQEVHAFDVDTTDAATAIHEFGSQSGVQILASADALQGKHLNNVNGEFSTDEALTKLLAGTGLAHQYVGDRAVAVVSEANVPSGAAANAHAATVAEENATSSGTPKKTGWFERFRVAQVDHGKAASEGAVEKSEKASDNNERVKLEEIVVTAQKREQSLKDVPFSIAALGGDEIARRGITNLNELALSVPDLAVANNGGAGGRYITIRGIGNMRGTSSLIGVYYDEAFASNGAGWPGTELDLRFYDLDRIEVLRGPQGTLYGQGSMGGTVRLIANKPNLTQFEGSLEGTTDFTKGGDPSRTITGVFSAPLIEDKLGVRIAGTYENTGGWMDQPGLGLRNINDEELTNIRFKALWRPVEQLTAELMAIRHHNNTGALTRGENENGDYIGVSFGGPELVTPTGENNYDLFNATLVYDFGRVALTSSSTYLDYELIRSNSGYRLPLSGPPPDGNWDVLENSAKTTYTFSQEMRLSSTGQGLLNWTIGAFLQDRKINEFVHWDLGIPPTFSPLIPFIYDRVFTYSSKAAFADASYHLTDKLEVGAGGRYFEDDVGLINHLDGSEQGKTFNTFNPRAYLSYAFTNDIKGYANVAKGFRSGGFNTVGLPEYKPDSLWTYEVGSKATLFDRRVSAEVALYYSDYKDVQEDVIDLVSNNVQFTSNGGDARVKGVDVNLQLQATDNLSLGVSGNWTDAKYTKINAQTGTHNVGDRLDFVPDYRVSFWSMYKFKAIRNTDAFALVDFSEQGKSRWGELTSGPWYFSYSGVIDMLNARLGWNPTKATTFELYGQNLLNERDYVDALSILQIAARPRPRTFGVTLRYTFD